MNRLFKYLTVLGVSFMLCSTVFAARVDELEPNDTPEQAQTIERNNPRPDLMINGNQTGVYAVVGNIDNRSDIDWYKVYLPANNNTILSINSDIYSKPSFEIYDESLNVIKRTIDFQKDPNFLTAFPYSVNIPSTGYYYVKVSTYVNGGSYIFTIGEPNYLVDSYKYIANSSLTLNSSTQSVQMTYDLTQITSIPEKAIVYELTIKGTKTGAASSESRSIKLSTDYSWYNTSTYTWRTLIPVSSNKLLRSKWVVKLDGSVYSSSKPYTLTPEITFRYVYPVLPK